MDGYLNLIKPPGMTSHDMVSLLRRMSGQKRVGHAGTLDPAAAGLMVLALGKATRLLEYAVEGDKTYRAELLLGMVTDTQDSTGIVLERHDASRVAAEDVMETAAGFRGELKQLPPMVSAVKVGGRRLYSLAREGVEVEREERAVNIRSLEVLDFVPGHEARALLNIVCSRGTYVRTICHDMGRRLGCGGVLSFLVRTASGGTDIRDALTVRRLERTGVAAALLPMDRMAAALPAADVDAAQAARLVRGNGVAVASAPEGFSRVYGQDGGFIGIAEGKRGPEGIILHPRKVLADEDIQAF